MGRSGRANRFAQLPALLFPATWWDCDAIRRRTAGRLIVFGLSAASILLGIGAIARPDALARMLGEASLAGRRAGRGYYRLLGVRDIIVGAGLIAGLCGGALRPWLLARAGADLVDALTIGLPALRSKRPRQALTGLGLPLASAATALGLQPILNKPQPRP